MTSLFAAMTTDGLAEAIDVVGGKYTPLETGIYTGVIKLAYAGTSDAGAGYISFIIDIAGREYKETIYYTNRAGDNFYMDKKTGKKTPSPGFTVVNDICLVASGKPLSEQDTADKVVKLYDFNERKEVPKTATVLVDLINKPVAVALTQSLQNKQVKDANGKYVATLETLTAVNIEKVLHPAQYNKTVAEINSGSDSKYAAAWLSQRGGKVSDKRTIKSEGAVGVVIGKPTAPTMPVATAPAPTTSLFAKKA